MNIVNATAAFRNGHLTLGDLPQELLEHESARIMQERFGFVPAYRIAVAGTASSNLHGLLVSAERLLQQVGYLPIELEPEPENPYDDKAILVKVPRARALSKFKYFEKIGYIPRGICLDCGSSATKVAITKKECFKCGSANIDPLFNASLFDDVKKGLYKGIVEWIGTNKVGHNIGVRIAIGKK